MLTGNQANQETGRSEAADWRHWLAKDSSLSRGLRESYRRTLEGFDPFCLKRAGGAGAPARPTVALVREFVEQPC